MGDLQGSSSPCFSSTPSFSSFGLCPLSIDPELWLMAEKRTQEILWIIQPVLASDKRRKDVIDYIRRLIKGYHAIEIFSFGSVPLKTYLPDGDIDLTVLSYQKIEEDLASQVCNVLKNEEDHPMSEVKDVQYIQAQVKVVKCSVKNILVDISFNQMEGICTLCFLEQVDRLIGKDHLLKHSIILIKAWCFYESRILGAYHGLISTYALEILVLHVINMFHSSLPGPLAVLYKFLDYYSTFDWENYCASIIGPVKISSLSESVADSLDNNGNELLISPEMLNNLKEKFLIPIKSVDNGSHEFVTKHLNILDPLKETNNLGRSVHQGNFHRIKRAFTYGAQKLREILVLPGEGMGAKLDKFFVNTLDRNGKGERPDILVPVHAFGSGRYELSDLRGDYDNHYNSLIRGQLYHNYSLPVPSTICPAPPSFQIQPTTWDTSSRFLRCKQHVFPQRGTAVFVPRVPVWHPYASQQCASTSRTDDLGKSRGTGPYIPDVSQHPYKNMLSAMKMKKPGSSTHGQIRSPRKDKEVKNDRGTKKIENSSDVNLSPDEFPLLSLLQKLSLEINQPSMTNLKSPQEECSSSSSSDTEFMTLRHLTSSDRRNQAEPGAVSTSEIIQVESEVGMLKQQDPSDTDKGM